MQFYTTINYIYKHFSFKLMKAQDKDRPTHETAYIACLFSSTTPVIIEDVSNENRQVYWGMDTTRGLNIYKENSSGTLILTVNSYELDPVDSRCNFPEIIDEYELGIYQ